MLRTMTVLLIFQLVGEVVVEAGHLARRYPASMTAIDVSPLNMGLLDAIVRLVRLLDSPTETRLLAPLVTREIPASAGGVLRSRY